MNKESFKILKEINSLNLKLIEYHKIIKEELERIDKINLLRSERQGELDSDLEELKDKKSTLLEVDKKSEYFDKIIKDSKSQMVNAFDEKEIKALELQIENATNSLNEYQEQGLILLEEIDELETKTNDAKNFLQGSLATIEEIKFDINAENDNLFKEIDNIHLRLDNLHTQIPQKASERIISLIKAKPKLSPLAHISSTRNCDICGYLIPQVTERAVEVELKLMSCPGCTRILLPQSIKF